MHSDQLFKSLYAITARKGCLYPSLFGILHEDGALVASDGFAIVSVKAEYASEKEGKIFNNKCEEVKEKGLNYKSVLPYDPERTLKTSDYAQVLNIADLKEALELIPKSPDITSKRIGLEIEGALFYPPLVQRVLRVFDALEESFRIFVHTTGTEGNSRLILLSASGSIGVIMPLFGVPTGLHPQKYTIKEVLECGDLL